jgi:hypothetical protein
MAVKTWFATVREELRLRMLDDEVLRKMIVSKKGEAAG